MNEAMIKSLKEYADYVGCDVQEFNGQTFYDVLDDAESESPNIRVFWGCWTDAELDTVVSL